MKERRILHMADRMRNTLRWLLLQKHPRLRARKDELSKMQCEETLPCSRQQSRRGHPTGWWCCWLDRASRSLGHMGILLRKREDRSIESRRLAPFACPLSCSIQSKTLLLWGGKWALPYISRGFTCRCQLKCARGSSTEMCSWTFNVWSCLLASQYSLATRSTVWLWNGTSAVLYQKKCRSTGRPLGVREDSSMLVDRAIVSVDFAEMSHFRFQSELERK